MQKYETFSICTEQALFFTMQTLKVDLSAQDQEQLIEDYQSLRSFPDVVTGLLALKTQGYTLVAFSNGVEATVRTLLEQAGILSYLDDVVSVDDLKTFKPDPKVYAYLAHRLGCPMHETWLVSSNSWDVIGAKSAGLKSAWLQRQHNTVFDPWGILPDLVVDSMEELSKQLEMQAQL